MSDATERYRSVAEALIAVPRYFSREKVRLLGTEGVASIVSSISSDPDQYTREFVDEPDEPECSVCGKRKHPIYYGGDDLLAKSPLKVCRYCRWRIKSKADEQYRRDKGLPVKPPKKGSEEPTSLLNSEQIASLDEFLRERENRPPDVPTARVRLPEDAFHISGYYGPGFANIASGWYSKTDDENYGPDRKRILTWWTDRHDAVIEWFLGLYGMFIQAACGSIELEINRIQGTSGRIARYFEYFVLDRIRKRPHLWDAYASDFLKRYQLKNTCASCGTIEPVFWIHPDNLEASHGEVLPLCNVHWKTYRRAVRAGGAADAAVTGQLDVWLHASLRTHSCPVCGSEHSWRDKTFTMTPGYYSIPKNHPEICSGCFNAAVNEQPHSRSTKKDLEGILDIAKIVGEPPDVDPFNVIENQAKTLDAATAVVRRMKEIVRFETLKRRHGSWFAVLAKSGCLPEGARREIYGTRILAQDGHECLSMAEMRIDNELHRLRIPHRKEVRYPNASFVCDWVAQRGDGIVYIEYFGLSGQAAYDEKIVQKRAALVQAGHELIELYFEDLARLNERIGALVETTERRGSEDARTES